MSPRRKALRINRERRDDADLTLPEQVPALLECYLLVDLVQALPTAMNELRTAIEAAGAALTEGAAQPSSCDDSVKVPSPLGQEEFCGPPPVRTPSDHTSTRA